MNDRNNAQAGRQRTRDGISEIRRASAQERDNAYYAKKRRRLAARRRAEDRATFDPSPPDDDDWTMPDEHTDGITRVRRPTPVGQTLHDMLERRGWHEQLRSTAVWTHWDDIVGDDLRHRCEPVRLVNGVLTVRAESQAWATQLRYLTASLCRRTDAVVGQGTVTDLAVTVGPLQGTTAPRET